MTEFTCSMDGYVTMAADLIELSLFALAILKETYAYILPYELGKSVEYAWDGLVGAGSWVGYAVAALYYFGLEYGYADMMCEYSGYGAIAIDYLTFFIDFAS
jgi:hypothetical protein